MSGTQRLSTNLASQTDFTLQATAVWGSRIQNVNPNRCRDTAHSTIPDRVLHAKKKHTKKARKKTGQLWAKKHKIGGENKKHVFCPPGNWPGHQSSHPCAGCLQHRLPKLAVGTLCAARASTCSPISPKKKSWQPAAACSGVRRHCRWQDCGGGGCSTQFFNFLCMCTSPTFICAVRLFNCSVLEDVRLERRPPQRVQRNLPSIALLLPSVVLRWSPMP